MEAFTMPGVLHSGIVVVTRCEALIQEVERGLRESGLAVSSAPSMEEAAAAMAGPIAPDAMLLDSELPEAALGQILAGVNAAGERRRFPILLVCDNELPAWPGYLSRGLIDDLVPRTMPPFHWRVRIQLALRTFRGSRQSEQLNRSAVAVDRGTDLSTGVLNREAFLSALFRETDRVQRMKSSLSILMFEMDDFAGWKERLGPWSCEDLLRQVVGRIQRLLRTYDTFGRMGRTTFALCLPGCATASAVALAERMRAEVFGPPFRAGSSMIHLTGCCGIAPSHGRSPLVVLRDTQQALESAKTGGQGSISAAANERPCLSRADVQPTTR